MISRLLQNIGLFCRIRVSFAEYRSHLSIIMEGMIQDFFANFFGEPREENHVLRGAPLKNHYD